MNMVKKNDPRLKQFERTVVDFITNDNGHFIVLSEDPVFSKILKQTVHSVLALGRQCISVAGETKDVFELVKDLNKQKKKPLIFAERFINGRSSADFIESLRAIYDNFHCILLSGEVERGALVYFYEVGVDNFIIKPLSSNTLIEKVALTLKPQTKIGDLIDKAKQNIRDKKYEDALTISSQILELKPNSAAALMIRGDAFYHQGNKGKAIEAYRDAHTYAKLYLEPLKRLANFYRQEGDVHAQIEYLGKLDELSPLNIRRKLELGQLNIEVGNLEEAERYFEEAIDSTTKEAYSTISDVTTNIIELCENVDATIAEKFCRRALELKKNMLTKGDMEIFNRLGIALRRQGKWDEAVKEYEKALRIAPGEVSLLYNSAMAYMEGKDYEKARKQIKKSLKKGRSFIETNAPVAFNVGMIFHKNADNTMAKKYFEKALAADPGFQAAHRMISKLS